MKMVKSLLLGSAAGLVAVTAGQAADLPVKAKPVEYVKVCSLYGAGFFYIPGTDKCLKLGGYFREQWNIHGAGDGQAYMNSSGRWDRTDTSDSSFRTRTLFSIDVREQSAYGTIRAYGTIGAQQTTPNDANSAVFFNRSFVQFAGFTGGRAVSFFDLHQLRSVRLLQHPAEPRQHRRYRHQRVCLHVAARQRRVVLSVGGRLLRGKQYRFDHRRWRRAAMPGRTMRSIAGSLGVNAITWDNAGYNIPELSLASARVDQAWGSAQVMGAYHKVGGGYYGSTTTFNQNLGHPGDEAGWAVGAGFLLKDVFGLKGDTFGLQGNFAEGAVGYLTNGVGALEGFSGGANGFGNSVAMASVTDGIFTTGSSIELTTGWTVGGLYEHHWTPDWKTSVYGGYVKITYDDTAAQMYCGYSSSSPRGSASTSSGALGGYRLIVRSEHLRSGRRARGRSGTRTRTSISASTSCGTTWTRPTPASRRCRLRAPVRRRPAVLWLHRTPPGTTSRTTTCTRWPFARSTTSCRDRLIIVECETPAGVSAGVFCFLVVTAA